MMNVEQKVSRTELARNTRRVLSSVQRGRTALIENYGEPEAALLDIVDYRILRAVVRTYANPPDIALNTGLSDDVVRALDDQDARYALVFAHHLAGNISLARAAELLEMPWLELRTRCLRLDVPLRAAPEDIAEAASDVAAAADW